jgi:hypothetical protein
MAELCLGAGDGAVELTFDADTMRVLSEQATAAISEMDALFEKEEAERAAAEPEPRETA